MKELCIAKESTNPHHRPGLVLSDQKKTYHDKHLIMDHLSFKSLHIETIIYETVRQLDHCFGTFHKQGTNYSIKTFSFPARKVLVC